MRILKVCILLMILSSCVYIPKGSLQDSPQMTQKLDSMWQWTKTGRGIESDSERPPVYFVGDVTFENICFMSHWESCKYVLGMYVTDRREIYVRRTEYPLDMYCTVVHEMVHAIQHEVLGTEEFKRRLLNKHTEREIEAEAITTSIWYGTLVENYRPYVYWVDDQRRKERDYEN